MNSRILLVTIIVLVGAIVPSNGIDDGKYKPNQYAKKGQYVHEDNGKYEENPTKWRYVHVHDQRERGKYIHVHIPYDGGYGPYSHLNNPYIHEDNPYIHDIEPKGEYSHLDPFRTDVFYIEKPQNYQEYGFPNHDPFGANSNDKDTKKPTSIQDKIIGASSDPFEKKFFHIEKPTITQEYGFPNHDPTLRLSQEKSKLKPLQLDVRFTGSSSSLGTLVKGANLAGLRTSANSDELSDPFKKNFFNVDKPEIPLEYGFPDHREGLEKSSPSATEIIFVSSTARPPKRNVEILREGRSETPQQAKE